MLRAPPRSVWGPSHRNHRPQAWQNQGPLPPLHCGRANQQAAPPHPSPWPLLGLQRSPSQWPSMNFPQCKYAQTYPGPTPTRGPGPLPLSAHCRSCIATGAASGQRRPRSHTWCRLSTRERTCERKHFSHFLLRGEPRKPGALWRLPRGWLLHQARAVGNPKGADHLKPVIDFGAQWMCPSMHLHHRNFTSTITFCSDHIKKQACWDSQLHRLQ